MKCDKCKKEVKNLYPKITREKGRLVKVENFCEKCTDYLK